MHKRFLNTLCAIAMMLCLSGCGIIDYIYLPPASDTAQELYENGNEAMRNKEYRDATEYFTKLKDNYPFSPYTIEAELSLGDALFLEEEYEEAAEAYKDFEDLHPRNESMPYVLYQVGMSNLNSFFSIDRPTTMVQEAYEYFLRLQATYPNTEYATKATEHILKCRDILADRELYIADVYYRTEKFNAAWLRYVFVTENFQDIPKAVEYAKEKAAASYMQHRAQESQEIIDEREGTWKDYFDWL